jgi:amidase
VATGIGPIAQGNDIAGSVRFPAYCCGIIGLRVGLGRIPSFNHTAKVVRGIGAQLMATQGPLTRTVRDARLALAIMAKGDRRDTRWVDAPLTGPPPPRPIRVALVGCPPHDGCQRCGAARCEVMTGHMPKSTHNLCAVVRTRCPGKDSVSA